MGFKMKFQRLFLAVLVAIYGERECSGFSIDTVDMIPLGVDLTMDFTPTLINSTTQPYPLCVYDTDNGELALDQWDTSLTTEPHSHAFPNPGWFDINVICMNQDNFDIKQFQDVYVGNFITGLSATLGSSDVIISVPHPVVSEPVLPITVVTGTDYTVEVRPYTAALGVSRSGLNESDQVDFPLSINHFVNPGMYAVLIKASNPLTENLNITVVLAVLQPVSILSMTLTSYATANPRYVMVNEPVSFVTTFEGDDTVLTWEIVEDSVGTVGLPGFYCAGRPGTHTLTHTFSAPGSFSLNQTISNYINEAEYGIIEVIAIHKVNGHTDVVTDETTLISNSVDFKLDLDTGADFSMGHVTCNFNWGNGLSFSEAFDYTTSPVSFTFTKTYVYPAIGHFIAVIRCANELPPLVNFVTQSYQEFVHYMIILNDVDAGNLVLSHDSIDNTKHPFSRPIIFTIALQNPTTDPHLPNITCTVDFGSVDDPPIPVTGDATDLSQVEITKTSFSQGEKTYTTQVTCTNELTSHVFNSIPFDVYYDCWLGMFFDPKYKIQSTPMIGLIDKIFTVRANVQLANLSVCVGTYQINWVVYDDTLTVVGTDVVTPPTTPDFPILKYGLKAGLFKFEMTQTIHGATNADGTPFAIPPALTDYLWVRVDHAELYPKIDDGDGNENTMREVLRGSTIVLDSSNSYDGSENPAAPQPWLMAITETKSWTCHICTPETTRNQVNTYIGMGPLPPGAVPCDSSLLPATDQDVITLEPNATESGRWYIYTLNYSRGSRSKQAIQAIQSSDKPKLDIVIQCVSNCFNGGDTRSKIRRADLQVNVAVLNPEVDNGTCGYYWTFELLKPDGTTVDLSTQITGARDGTGLRVKKNVFDDYASGTTFLLTCQVTIPDDTYQSPSTTSMQYIYNFPPYGGTCAIDKQEAVAAYDWVCISCKDYKDENFNLFRDPATDEPGLLTYEVNQRYLDGNQLTDRPEIYKDSGSNSKICVQLNKPVDNNNLTMLEMRVKDFMGSPWQFMRYIIKVKPPIAYDVSGEGGASQVTALLDSFGDTIEDALSINDSTSVAAKVSVAASTMNMGGPAVETVLEQEVNAANGGMTDRKADGTVVSVDDAMEGMKKQPVDATTQALRDAKAILAHHLAHGVKDIPPELKIDPTMQRTMMAAAATIVAGDENGIDNPALETVGNVISASLENVEEMVKQYGDTNEFRQYIEDCLGTLSDLSDQISPDEIANAMTIGSQDDARASLEEQYAFASPEEKEQIENADMSEDERAHFLKHTQLRLAAKKDQRKQLAAEQAVRTEAFLDTVLTNVPPSDGAIQKFGDHADSKAVTTTTRVPADQVKDTKLPGKGVEVQLPAISSGGGKVDMGIIESKTVLNMDDDNRFATITSGQMTMQVIGKSVEFDGLVTMTFKVPKSNRELVEQVIDEADADDLHRIRIWVKSKDDMVCVSYKPADTTEPAETIVESFKVWIACNGKDVTKLNFDTERELNEENKWTTCFEPSTLSLEKAGICRYGIETFLKDSVDGASSSSSSRKKRSASNSTSTSGLPPMNGTAATMACLVLDDEKSWKSDRCSGRWLPDEGRLLCDCLPEIKMTFANSFYVPPNTIDFGSVFLKFSPLNQAAVMGVIAGILIIYVLVVIWARRKDRKDLLKWGITPLADNFAEDNYFYVIKVSTGIRPGAGTRSKVGLVIAGEEMDTGVREISDGVRKEFKTGSMMNFLMSTNVYLGDLEYIRIWHDNSGQGNNASWYLSQIEVQDVQRNETFQFLAQRWLAVEKDDGMLECVVPVCKVENLNVFKNRFFINAKENLADSHIWVSVVYRPSTSSFTRVQRATCALVFLMLTMISNAMFFRGDENYETPAEVQVGPFRFTMQQIYISLICALITTPATLVIIYLFKLSRLKPVEDKQLFSVKPDRSKRYKIPLVETWFDKQQRKSMELEQSLVAKGYPQIQGFSLPYRCRHLAWFLAFACWFLSGFFIMLYSMEWGKQKSEEWLTTFVLSFFESVFCLDPIKIAVMAVVFAILIRSASDSKAVIDRSTIMKKYKSNLRGRSGGVRLPAPPLDTDKLEKVRSHRQIELKMKTALKDLILNIFIIWILFSLSFATRDVWSYNMHKETVETLLSPPNQMSFYDIKTTNDWFDWLNNTAIMNLFPEDDSRGTRLHWRLRQFMQDGSKLRVGPPRLRQLRTTEKSCKIPYFGTEDCYKKYSEPTEDTSPYCIGWNDSLPCDPEEKLYQFSADSWEFTSAFDIWGFPIAGYYTTYGGGGYISKLSVNREVSHLIIDELYKNSWVDRQTRSVVFEFTLYCLNTNIFTYNVFMAEFPETGGVFPYVMILPLRVYMHNGALGMYTLMCEIIFLIYLVVITVMTIIMIVQQKKAFFKQPWQVYDFIFVIISYLAMIMYFTRYVMTTKSLNAFKEDKKAFVNFFHISLWDQMFVLTVGILAYMSVLRLLNVFGYNKRISAVARVFTNAATELVWFGIFFLNVFLCYAVFGYLLFGSKLKSYKNVYKTMGTLFISMIGKSRFTEIEDADPMMSKIYFMIFIFFVVYMILTMFLAVLSKSIDQVHEDTKKTKGDEMVEYVIKKFKNMLSAREPEPKNTGGMPPAPWNMTAAKRHWNDIDNRAILEDIRQSLNDAILFDPEGIQKKAGKARPGPSASK